MSIAHICMGYWHHEIRHWTSGPFGLIGLLEMPFGFTLNINIQTVYNIKILMFFVTHGSLVTLVSIVSILNSGQRMKTALAIFLSVLTSFIFNSFSN